MSRLFQTRAGGKGWVKLAGGGAAPEDMLSVGMERSDGAETGAGRGYGCRAGWWRAGWWVVGLCVNACWCAELQVGPGRAWEDLAAAVEKAGPGDVVVVHPRAGHAPYRAVGLRIRAPGIVLRSGGGAGGRVPLSGEGADLSGRGLRPRAIVQFDPGADGCVLEGFELWGARNESGNAAGVRVTGARGVVIRDCEIRDNDMGIMSDGADLAGGGGGLRIEGCVIWGNGRESHAGYAHNLYLGGESVALVGCHVHSARTGHNLKSRAHRLWVLACYFHDAAERELDLVDAAGWTTRAGSDAVVAGCVLVKAVQTRGNREVIHFGQDGGHDRVGRLELLYNTVVSPHRAPVVILSAPGANAWLEGNVIWDMGRVGGPAGWVAARSGADLERVRGDRNWVGSGFGGPMPAGLVGTHVGAPGLALAWRDGARGDYGLRVPVEGITDAGPECFGAGSWPWPAPLYEYRPPLGFGPRRCVGRLDLGAFEFGGDR